MRRVVLVLRFRCRQPRSLTAQRPKQAPQFEPGDAEGLVVSPNPRVRHAWKRKVFWRVSPPESSRPSRLHSSADGRRTGADHRGARRAHRDPEGHAHRISRRGVLGAWTPASIDYADPFDVPATTPLAKFPLTFSTGLFPFYHSDLESNGTWRLSVAGETESVYFHFNRLPAVARCDTDPHRGAGWRPRAGTALPAPARHRHLARAADLRGPASRRRPRGTRPLGGRAAGPRTHGGDGRLREGSQDRGEPSCRLQDGARDRDERRRGRQQKRETFEKQNGELRTSRPSNYGARLRSLENEIVVLRQEAQTNAQPQKDAKGAWYWNPVDAHDEAARRLAALSPDEAAGPACFVELPTAAARGRPLLARRRHRARVERARLPADRAHQLGVLRPVAAAHDAPDSHRAQLRTLRQGGWRHA